MARNRGYIGILMVLVGVVLGMYMLIHFDVFGLQKNEGNKTTVEQNKEYVERAKDTKALMERTVQTGE